VMGVVSAREPRGPPAVRPGRGTHHQERRVDLVRDPSWIPPLLASAMGCSVEDGGSVGAPSWIRSPALPRVSMLAAFPLGAGEPIVGDPLASPGRKANPRFPRERRERGREDRSDGRRRRRRGRGSGIRGRGGRLSRRRWRGLVGRRGRRFRRGGGAGWRGRHLGTRDRSRPRRKRQQKRGEHQSDPNARGPSASALLHRSAGSLPGDNAGRTALERLVPP
jgi:hypothetical protein